MPETPKTGTCSVCEREMRLRKDGTLWHHAGQSSRGSSFLSNREYRCEGAGLPPKEALDA